MRIPHIRYHAPVRRGDVAQRRNFTRGGHPHLHHRRFVLRSKIQQLQRQAEVVVQIPLRLQHPELCPQYCSNRLLRRRLTRRARYRHHAPAPVPPHCCRQRLQRLQRIIHQQQRMLMPLRQQIARPFLRHHSRARALPERLRNKIMRIEALAADRKEQVAGNQRSRINRVSGRLPRQPAMRHRKLRARPLRNLLQ